jgi:hypothetical protein
MTIKTDLKRYRFLQFLLKNFSSDNIKVAKNVNIFLRFITKLTCQASSFLNNVGPH